MPLFRKQYSIQKIGMEEKKNSELLENYKIFVDSIGRPISTFGKDPTWKVRPK